MSQTEDNSQYDYCHEEVQLSEKVYGLVYTCFIGMLVGFIEGFQPPVVFSSDEGLTIDEHFSMKVLNSTAYSIEKLIGILTAGKRSALAVGRTAVMANASEGMQEALSDLLDGNTDNSEKMMESRIVDMM